MNKENIFRAAPTVSVIAAGAAACGLAGYIIAQWPAIEGLIKPAIVSGAFTIAAAIGGVLVVFWQLRKQAENTVKANALSEALKLKKAIYDDILKGCKAARTSAGDVQRFAESFHDMVARSAGVGYPIPYHTVEDFTAKTAALSDALGELVQTARSWTTIEPRLSHYYEVYDDAERESTVVVIEFYGASILHFADRSVKPAGWKKPDSMQLAQLDGATKRLSNFVDNVLENVASFQSEMQTALLGELLGSPGLNAPLSSDWKRTTA